MTPIEMQEVKENTLARLLGRKTEALIERTLPRSVVTHDSIDDLHLDLALMESPRFRELTVEDAPRIEPLIEALPDIDLETASPEEIADWQEKAQAAKAVREEAPEYKSWADLTGDTFRSYHTLDRPEIVEEVDPGVELHKRIEAKLIAQEDHARARDITRDHPPIAEMATIAAVGALRESLKEEMLEAAQHAQELEERRDEVQEQQDTLEAMREEAKGYHDQGVPVPAPLVEGIKRTVKAQRGAVAQAEGLTEPPPMGTEVMAAVAQAAAAGVQAAEAGALAPSFGSGLGAGEPVYTSPEQALAVAERWANNPDLKKMAELFGRFDPDIRFKRSKRVEGGNDEIVDIKLGNNLPRVLPSELGLLADADMEDDFFMRYVGEELFEFSTVGEENAGRGPILIVLDGSGSMKGERNIWSRGVAMCLLHIARLEKRDFGCIEFSSGGQLESWLFPAREALDGERVIEMASHFFNGGTTPIIGMQRAAEVMSQAPEFKKADIVLVGDGDAGYGPEDERLRVQLQELGVRLFGIAVGGEMTGRSTYLHKYCEYVVDVQDFDLTDPGAATDDLATQIT